MNETPDRFLINHIYQRVHPEAQEMRVTARTHAGTHVHAHTHTTVLIKAMLGLFS